MTGKPRRSAAEAGITVEPNPNRVIVRLGADIIADSTNALVMRAPGTPPAQYIPRADVDMARLIRSPLATYCPYKGDAAYWSIRSGEQVVDDAVWSYETPHDEVAEIREHLSFYPDRVTSIEERPRPSAPQ
jgi:uncharacterized protein (DUF427 family)